MISRNLFWNTGSPPSNGARLKVKDASTGEVEEDTSSGGGAAVINTSGTLQGVTDAGSDATAPPILSCSMNGRYGTVGITFNGVIYRYLVDEVTPEGGTPEGVYFCYCSFSLDSVRAQALADGIGATVGDDLLRSLNGSGGLQLQTMLQGSSVDLEISENSDALLAFVSGGGTGTDAVAPSGDILELTLAAADGTKATLPVRCGWYGDGSIGMSASIQFCIKVPGVGGDDPAYYPLGDAASGDNLQGELRMGAAVGNIGSSFVNWTTQYPGSSLIARLIGSPPAANSTLSVFAVASQS